MWSLGTKEELEALQEAAREKGRQEMREHFEKLQKARKEQKAREEQQAREQQAQEEASAIKPEPGEVIESGSGVVTEVKAEEDGDIANQTNGYSSDEIVVATKTEPKSEPHAGNAREYGAVQAGSKKAHDRAAEKAHLQERQLALAKQLAAADKGSSSLQQQHGKRLTDPSVGNSPQQRDEDPLASWGARKEPRQKNREAGHSSSEDQSRSAKLPRLDTSKAPNGRKDSVNASGLQSAKRKTSAEGFGDDRHQNKKKASVSASSSSAPSPLSSGELSENKQREPPGWYSKMKFESRGGRDKMGVDQLLNALKDKVKRAQKGDTSVFQEIRDRLHKIFFVEVNKQMLRNTKMLDNESGLPQLFDKNFAKSVDWPYDIKADAEELYNKWCRQDFATDIMRGINCGKPKVGKKSSKETIDRSSDRLLEGYPTINANYFGNRHLLNGQWWPTQLTCLRDGAHGSSQAGISGGSIEDKVGAYSCIMSGGHEYGEDKDMGDVVLYCGTDCKDGSGTITDSTWRMIHSVGKNPVRLIRSHNLNSDWAPKIGFRYDGLYDVVEMEKIDPPGHPRARHRFKLVRRPGQDPIRGGKGPERRPTDQEIEAYEKDKRLRGY